MKQEEAIKWLEYSKDHYDGLDYGAPRIAVDMAISALREQLTTKCHQLETVTNRNGLNGWIPTSERLPTKEEEENGIVGIINGFNGNITFSDAQVFLRYDFDEQAWWSEDYNIEGCEVVCWVSLPEFTRGKR